MRRLPPLPHMTRTDWALAVLSGAAEATLLLWWVLRREFRV